MGEKPRRSQRCCDAWSSDNYSHEIAEEKRVSCGFWIIPGASWALPGEQARLVWTLGSCCGTLIYASPSNPRPAKVAVMSEIFAPSKPQTKARTERPPLFKVILLNDDFTPRDFVTMVLKAVFRMTEAEALGVMLTAHKKGACVVAVFTREVAETKAAQGNDLGRTNGFPLAFTTEKEE